MIWEIEYTKEADKDFSRLSGPQKLHVTTALNKVRQNPLPQSEGGYGKPLGKSNRLGVNLTNYLKVKLRDDGIRVVYKLVKTETKMLIIVIGIRDDDEVYKIAAKRIRKDLQ